VNLSSRSRSLKIKQKNNELSESDSENGHKIHDISPNGEGDNVGKDLWKGFEHGVEEMADG